MIHILQMEFNTELILLSDNISTSINLPVRSTIHSNVSCNFYNYIELSIYSTFSLNDHTIFSYVENIYSNNNILNIINTKENIFKSYAEKISPKFFENRVNESEKKLKYYKEKLYEQIKKILTDKKNTAEQVFVRLESINPENIIKRGYSLVYKNNTLIKSVNQTNIGELVKIQLSDGFVYAQVKEILKGEDNGI